ncbi:hypothetical protein LTR91_014316 [Friedmanniomyces endolithicus]|uniref:Mannan endo-1,6-alpha-mannosidase n=1 Tax=Friedmanniomyces endolithicus TaxID=329885 RepID=A0AAN6KC83_9PEZI|nr:hypothetical protein LTR87_012860 [Friedmanniomyces endolithicus]KAK0897386.1 hypothetical protein LTR57_022111 [Friedmanniomyces endolithicus]KAK0961176.1 hypothetical protein LTS01_020489 [Friedmanniomyces endolithicus]KAK0974638.1 hypothetical protein LTR91_014316 [Friedmanniomyces endolithicus]KAK1025321.1 hypothetical protein LTS16_023318 [Friedmanniomyces endolithicus]
MSPSVQLVVLAVFAASALCLDLDISNQTSIKQAAATIAGGLYEYHNTSSTAGLFNQPEPWFWWLSGAGWTALIDYTAYTNDTTYISDIHTALSQNLGSNYDFVPAEQSGWEANDDQVYWVYSALTAMEYGFPPLPCKAALNNTVGNCTNSWQAVAVHAFEDFVTRWNLDSQTCGGGLKWQYDPMAKGWTYKNSVSNAGFFQTAARLARYTGNETYTDWATKIWNWSVTSGLVGSGYHVYDGSSDGDGANCSSVDHDEWSYNIASYLHGAAHMSAHTHAPIWTTIVTGLLDTATTTFFSPFPNATGIMYEPICEKQAACSTDQSSFKGSLANWMGKTAVLVPSVSERIMALLGESARGAAAGCSGGEGMCGTKWYVGGFDGQVGFGQQLSALDAVLSLLVGGAPELAVLT